MEVAKKTMEDPILFLGDIAGRSGRRAVRTHLPRIREKARPQKIIANCENASGGIGITPETANELLGMGIDLLTSGNHIWKRREILPMLGRDKRLLRPANYPTGNIGVGYTFLDSGFGTRMGVLNLIGRTYMDPVDCPFRVADDILARHPLGNGLTAWIVDFHAEATSEKNAMAYYLDGRVTAVIGTHTHIPTADERILPKGTGFITDVGMTGCYQSVIGMEVNSILPGFLTGVNARFEPAENDGALCGVLIQPHERTGLCREIRPVRLGCGITNTPL